MAAAVPAAAWLAVFIAVSTLARAAVAKTHPAPWIFDDELIYAKLAASFAGSGHFAVRQVSGLFGYAPGYPILISPAYLLFDDTAHAYAAAKAINSLLMSLAAVPAYLIARRLVGPRLALLAAVLALALPSLEYTGTIMTENAFYPAFLLCVWGFLRALEQPTLARQAVALALIGVAVVIRVQAVLFAVAFACAIVLVVLVDAHRAGEIGRWRAVVRRLDAFRLTWIVIAAGGLAAVAIQLARGRSFGSLLGAYGDVTAWDYSLGTIARWFVYHVAELDVYSGFLPFAAFVAVVLGAFRRGQRSRATTAFAAVSLMLFVWLVVPAAALSAHLEVRNGGLGRIEERNTFYVVPLFLIATLVWAERGSPRGRIAAVAAVLAAALPGVIPFAELVNLSTLSDTLAFIPLARQVIGGSIDASHLPLTVTLAALVGAGVFVFLPRRAALVAPFAVLAFFIVWQIPVERQMHDTSVGVLQGSLTVRRDWIDEHAGKDGDVAALWTGGVTPTVITENEFFNRSLRRVYSAGAPPLPAQVPETAATVDEDKGRVLEVDGTPARTEWVLVDRTLEPVGERVAADDAIGTALYRTRGVIDLRARTGGLYGDRWSSGSVGYTRWSCRGGHLEAVLRNYPGLVAGGQVVTAAGGGDTVRTSFPKRKAKRRLLVPLRPKAGRCIAAFTIAPTAVPAQVLGTADARALGVRFDVLRYVPPR